MAENNLFCKPEQFIHLKIRRNTNGLFGNVSHIAELQSYSDSSEENKSIKTQIELMNNIRSVMVKEHERIKKCKKTMMDKYDTKKSFYDSLMNEKLKIIGKYKNKEIDEITYNILIRELDSIFEKISYHFDENSENTKHERLIRYFKPIFLKNSQVDFDSFIQILMDWRPFKSNLEEPSRKDSFLRQLNEYYTSVMQTDKSILESFDTFYYWKNNVKNWRELSHLIIYLMIQPPMTLERRQLDERFRNLRIF